MESWINSLQTKVKTMSPKTEQSLAAIFRHCQEVAEGKRPPRTEKEGGQAALAWLGVNKELTDNGYAVDRFSGSSQNKLDAFLRKGL